MGDQYEPTVLDPPAFANIVMPATRCKVTRKLNVKAFEINGWHLFTFSADKLSAKKICRMVVFTGRRNVQVAVWCILHQLTKPGPRFF